MPLKEQWTEFDWEQELRRDDARISAYFQELPRYIDLPAEDEIIYHSIRNRKQLIPSDGFWPAPAPQEEEEIPEGEEERKRFGEEWLKRDGAESYLRCGRIARQLCAAFAVGDTELAGAICLLGRIMARLADIISLEEGEMPAMQIALTKRFLADLNKILGILDQKPRLDQIRTGIMTLRQEILKLQERARSK